MATAQHPAYSAPFDAVAATYDASFTASTIGRAQRSAVWRELEKTFRPGERVLEIGCGTGVDACFLAERGVAVVACDSSPEMIAVTNRRIRERNVESLVQSFCLRAEDLSSLQGGEQLDGAFSNFGALNCVDDLRQVAGDLAKRVRTGSSVLLCVMGPWCFWEMAWYLAHGNRAKAFRRLHRDGVTARIADGAVLDVYYPSARTLARTFAPEFQLESIRGIGVAVPPSYVEPWAERHPRLLRYCERTDSWLGRCPGLRQVGDHVLVRLRRAEMAAGERR